VEELVIVVLNEKECNELLNVISDYEFRLEIMGTQGLAFIKLTGNQADLEKVKSRLDWYDIDLQGQYGEIKSYLATNNS